jgi:hypothetical protein
MKCIPILLLSMSAVLADDFTTGQAARAVIGQPTFTTQSDQSSATVLGAMSGLAYDAATDTLIVADSNRVSSSPINHRVLLFKNISSTLPAPTADLPYLIKCPVCVGQASVVLGQPDFVTTTDPTPVITQSNLRTPTAVTSDGVHLVVADTDHNRVLIWNSIPSTNDQPADVVVGQANFTSGSIPGNTPTANSMRGPQGVWLQNGKLYVADTQNNRVLIFNRIPTTNGAAADVVLGQPNMTTFVEPDLTQQKTGALATNLLNPVSVTSDGTRLYVTDLGFNRVLIWNNIPSTNAQAADVVVGQPDMVSAVPNNAFTTSTNAAGQTIETPVLCTVSNGTDANGNPTYPPECNFTLNFPRFALSDGQRLFIADGGNDRVLVFEQIPTQNAQAADVVIGQLGGQINQAYDGVDSLRTPVSMAWDGTNLYVSDTFNRRINVYSIGANNIPYTGVRNAASLAIYAVGAVTIALNASASITAGNAATIVIGNSATNAATCTAPTATTTGTTSTNCGPAYTYEVQTNDTLNNIVNGLTNQINSGSGDANVTASADFPDEEIILTAKSEGTDGNNVTISTTVSTSATITATATGATLTGGADAAKIAPGTIVSILGSGSLSFNTATADLSKGSLHTRLGGTEVFFNGIAAPLFYVSPSQINAQVPWEVGDQTSINAYVRSVDPTGHIQVTTPVAVTIVTQNPGIFTQQIPSTGNLKPGVVLHSSSHANGVVLIDGTITPNDVATVKIEDRSYNYTIQVGDTLDTVRLALTALINQDPKVTAVSSSTFATNLIIQARVPGPDGNNIPYSATSTHASGTATLIMTATNSTLCCANIAGSPVTQDNPAVPGETLLIYATGLGLPVVDASIQPLINTGVAYPANGPVTVPLNFVSSLAGGSTANILRAGLQPGTVGVFEILLQLNTSLPTDPVTQIHIAQDIYLSNIVTFPVVSPGATPQ